MRMKPRPAIKGLSIGYLAKEFEVGTKPTEPRRRLKRIDVVEISPVTFPANRKAKVTNVKAIEALASVREIEDFLCSGGMAKAQAVALIARIKGIGPGDPAGARGGPGDPAAELAQLAESMKRNTVVRSGLNPFQPGDLHAISESQDAARDRGRVMAPWRSSRSRAIRSSRPTCSAA
jgi:hypothetical protein